MTKVLLALVAALAVTACSSTKPSASTAPAANVPAMEKWPAPAAAGLFVATQYDDRPVQPPEFRLCDPGLAGCPAFTRKVYDVARSMATAPSAAAPAARTVTHRIFFALDSSALDADARTTIETILAEARAGQRIEIAGRTDPRGARPHNERLAQARADSVRAALVNGGVPKDRVTAVAASPCCDGPIPSTESDYAERRRATVTISITTTTPKGT